VTRRGINSTAHRSSPFQWTKTLVDYAFIQICLENEGEREKGRGGEGEIKKFSLFGVSAKLMGSLS
jgi:hypothetical protein